MTRRVPRAPFRPKRISLLLQHRALAEVHPWLTVRVNGAWLVAEGTCQPTPLTHEYLVRISYHLGLAPIAEVLDPIPARRDAGVRVIHTNGADSKPCLFLPKSREWHEGLTLANTVVPWLLEWLFFYEGWFATGKWAAGGVLPDDYPSTGTE